ncbi:MAG TPA: type I DNA topoisomerase [Anaerolineales bacterium]|nr:type I DNA topoisomerase [Anaerolineales bacterium]
MRCKAKRLMVEPVAGFTSAGGPITRGTCPVCGTTMVKMGRTAAHDGLTPPEPVRTKGPTGKKGSRRNGRLVIVESPAKARTVSRYLGQGYQVRASVGHVRDLLKSQLSVDVENGFEPKYRVPNDKRKVVKEIKSQAEKSKEVFLATDPDREGEAIAWHLRESAEIDPDIVKRVVFHEITEPAIREAFSHPRPINMDLVDAQQARRVLDRLVGYNLSPLLWRKVRGRLSAGRVQSVALRLVVEREREIADFEPQEYWTITGQFKPPAEPEFQARLIKIDEESAEFSNESQVTPVLEDMPRAVYQVDSVSRGQRTRNPSAPFITSTLQQDASRRLKFTTGKTMAVAQQLYEGIDLGEGGSTGLITYMRTDSTQVSEIAQNEARDYIIRRFGDQYVPPTPPKYQKKVRGAQEAHEAIRPTLVTRTPESLKPYLSRDQYRLYELVWLRFVASQMAAAIYATVRVEVVGKSAMHAYLLRASGSTVEFQGYQAIYPDLSSKENGDEDTNGSPIPPGLAKGQALKLIRLLPEQHFTQPPQRFSEASLVAALEENGIGRPSTYAPIVSTLQQRGYVLRENRRLIPTETGALVNDLLTEYFPNIVDVGFTAEMEKELDDIAEGERKWSEVVDAFYTPFAGQVEHALHEMPEVKPELESVGRECPRCGHDLVIRWGRFGKFISCSNFPECRHTEPFLEKIGVRCPLDGGELVERRTRRGRVFYGCENYPECDFSSWKRPVPVPCPHCGGLRVQANKKEAQCLDCGKLTPYEESLEMEPDLVAEERLGS